jgi:replicative DNA helicase
LIDNPNFYDIDAEKAVLGAVLVDNSCMDDIRSLLAPDDFYQYQDQLLWTIFQERAEKKLSINLISINDEVRMRGYEIDLTYITSLNDNVCSSANVKYYVKIVKDKSIKRSLWKINSASADDLVSGSKTGIEIANDLEQSASNLATKNEVGKYVKIASVLPDTIRKLEFYKNHPDELFGVTSGFKSVDNITGGIRDEDYVIIGARPSVGKSACAVTMANNIAIENHIPIGFFSCEMSRELINERQVFALSGMTKRRMKFGHLSKKQAEDIQNACMKIADAPFFIDDTPNITLSAFRASARKMIHNEGVKIIFIDYAGLIDAEQPKLPRWQQMSIVSREIKQFTRENKVPVVALMQLRRESEGKRPSLADLRDSGSFEQDGDTIFFLHREHEPELNSEIIETDLICAKQRNGPVGTIKLNFYPELVKFEDKE